jgi:hypothetical protein
MRPLSNPQMQAADDSSRRAVPQGTKAEGSGVLQTLGVYTLRSPRAFTRGILTGRFPFSMLASWVRPKPWRLANALILPSCSIAALNKRRTPVSSNMSARLPKLPLASNAVISFLSVIGAWGITNHAPLAPPILLGLALDRWRFWVLDLNPMPRRIHKKEGRLFHDP